MKSVSELVDEGCGHCGAELSAKLSEVHPAAISFALASDRGSWTRPRVVLLCRKCATELDEQANSHAEGGYFTD